MIARSFRGVGWVAAVGTAALGCYMLSLRVAAERADLDRLDARIVAASQAIRSLQTELGTRGRMQQLEDWNNEVLALSAPVSGQFVTGGATLARFDVRQPEIAPDAEVRLASAEAPAPATPLPAAPAATPAPQRAVAAPAATPPLVRRASAIVPPAPAPAAAVAKPVQRVQSAAAEQRARPAATPPVRTAATPERPRAATPPPVRTAAAPERSRATAPAPVRTAAAPERSRPAPVATARRSASLLDDRTLTDLRSASRAERAQRGGGTAN
jgi:hypothetical protein